MGTYRVEVIRKGYWTVEADSAEEAEEMFDQSTDELDVFDEEIVEVVRLNQVDYKANARAFLADFLSDNPPEDIDAFAREEYANDDPKTRDKTQTFYSQAIRTLAKD